MSEIIPPEYRIATLTALAFFSEKKQENPYSAVPSKASLYHCGFVHEYGLADDELDVIVRELEYLGHVTNDNGVYWVTDAGKQALADSGKPKRHLTLMDAHP